MADTDAKIEIPGHILMRAPNLTPEEALHNLDQVVAGWTCNRTQRMALEQSLKVLKEIVLVQRAGERKPVVEGDEPKSDEGGEPTP